MSRPGVAIGASLALLAALVLVAVSTSPGTTVAVAVLLGAAVVAVVGADRARRSALLDHLDVDGDRGGDRGADDASRDVSWTGVEAAAAASAAARDEAQATLDRLEPWRSRLVESIEGPALVFSRAERLLVANDAARQLLAIPPRATDLPLAQALGSSSMADAVREAMALGRPVQVDAELRGRDLRATASAVGDGILVIVADRTERRRVEELRRNFVVNASHELKTPATSIRALTDALQVAVGAGSPRVPALLERLHEESERLVQLVHDLLDLRRLEDSGPLRRTPVDLVGVVRDVLADLRPGAEELDVELTSDLPDGAMLAGVEEDVRLVVHNLVANGIRYNQSGGRVEVAVDRDGSDLVLTVSDTGIGIPQGDLQRVFERFYRVDAARSRAAGGTGLGLSLVRNAVERHGGRVDVESLLGTGSTFTIRLPIEPRD